MKNSIHLLAALTGVFVLAATYALPAQAEDNPCLVCHAPMTQKKVVHPAVEMGCVVCHSELDTSAIPHKAKGKIAKGLSAEAPDLCMNCHEKKLFEGKLVHVPVEGGMCLTCHNPHASDAPAMLNAEPPAKLCLGCHTEAKKTAHVRALPGGHPVGDEGRQRADPGRKGKPFYCASCHQPHRSDFPKLLRYRAGMELCATCHKM